MKLKEWMELNKVSFRQLDALTGIRFNQLHRYASGKVVPSLKNARHIYLTTNKLKREKKYKGEVTLQDW
jgi:hypothetical protein